MSVYKLTALTGLKYRLRERPTEKDGYTIANGNSILITKEALGMLNLMTADNLKKPATVKHYTLEAR